MKEGGDALDGAEGRRQVSIAAVHTLVTKTLAAEAG